MNQCGELLFVTIDSKGTIIEKMTVSTLLLDHASFSDLLGLHAVDVLICGGIREECQRKLAKMKIRWIDNVIGSVDKVCARYIQGLLKNGDVVD